MFAVIIACTDSANTDETGNKAVRTIEKGARFSRKLQRRLTRRTLAEARALKEQGTECIHVLLYVAELVILMHILSHERRTGPFHKRA
jgi:hypothetical protein